jgi:hypothetical protein
VLKGNFQSKFELKSYILNYKYNGITKIRKILAIYYDKWFVKLAEFAKIGKILDNTHLFSAAD